MKKRAKEQLSSLLLDLCIHLKPYDSVRVHATTSEISNSTMYVPRSTKSSWQKDGSPASHVSGKHKLNLVNAGFSMCRPDLDERMCRPFDRSATNIGALHIACRQRHSIFRNADFRECSFSFAVLEKCGTEHPYFRYIAHYV